jgi:hypothetical protein
MRILGIVALCAALGGCAFQRAQIAQDARAQMVGLSKEQVLACMGAPANKAAEGATEVWGYTSGNGMTVASASYDRYGGTAVASSRFCNVNVVMASGRVTAVNYTGPTRRSTHGRRAMWLRRRRLRQAATIAKPSRAAFAHRPCARLPVTEHSVTWSSSD